jgi:DNA-binding beta-propeller fold protein YncE
MRALRIVKRPLAAAVLLTCAVPSWGQPPPASVPTMNYKLLIGNSPQSVVNGVMFDGQFIWAAVQNPNGGFVEKILPRTGGVLGAVQVGGAPLDLAFDGTNVWVTDYSTSDVQVINQAGQVINIFYLATGSDPEGIVFDGQYIWIANNGAGANSVTKIDAARQTLVATYPVGLNPDGVAYDGTYIWVTNSYNNSVWTIDRQNGQQVGAYATGIFPLSIIYDGHNMWVGNGTGVNVGPAVPGLSSLTKIRAADGMALGTFTVGHHVRGLTFDGTSIWACNGNDNTVSRIRANDVALLGTYPTGQFPRAVAFDGNNIWVANSGENSLTIIATKPVTQIEKTGFLPGNSRPFNGLFGPSQIKITPPQPGQGLTPAMSLLLGSN